MNNNTIILASKSKRRQELLDLIDVKHIDCNSGFEESKVKFENNVIEYVTKIAEGKVDNIKNHYQSEVILGADTVVYANDKILGKPINKMEAFNFLKILSCGIHQVITGLCIYNGFKKIKIKDHSITEVEVQKLTDDEIWWYINNDDVLDAAGAYRIQKGFSRYIKSIKGSYHNVVGLPVNIVYNHLKNIFLNKL